MWRVCLSNHHKGCRIFGIKRPLLNFSRTHGYCKRCFEIEMEKIKERRGKK